MQRSRLPSLQSLQGSLNAPLAMQGHTCIRGGSILVEAIVGCIVLGAAISMLLPAMAAVRRQRQALRFESLALVEMNNLDRSIPSVMDPDRLPELSDWFRRRYQNAHLRTELFSDSGDTTLPRGLRLTIHQPSVEFMPEQKTSLVIWRQLQETAP